MPIVIMSEGSLVALERVIDGWPLYCYPYKNDRTPKRSDLISMYTEADFSGYEGPIPLLHWGAPYLSNSRALASPSPVGWLHDGGPIDNQLYGVVVVDTSGNFVWAERYANAPVLISPARPQFNYQPVFSLLGEYSG